MLLGIGEFFAIWLFFMAALFVLPLIFTIWALVDIAHTPDAAFGPPWDNGKSAWTLGLALAFVIPMGMIVGPILWWTQVKGKAARGEPVPRPFWSSRPTYPPPYYPPQPPPQPPVGTG